MEPTNFITLMLLYGVVMIVYYTMKGK